MVSFKSFITAAVLSGIASALPRPQQDSAVGIEVAVSAPNGTPITDAGELASQSSFEAAQASATAGMGMNDMGMNDMGMGDMTMTESPMATSTPVYDGQYDNNGQWQQPPPNPQDGQWQQPPQDNTWAATTSTSAWVSYSSPSYGSGNSNWGGADYNDCVNQCIASYGAPAATYAPPTATSGEMGSTGTGATHTVIVAPSQGVLRYVPFAVNASVGDTIKFMWNANGHTVTHGTALAPCNKSAENPFTSGIQNSSFVYTQVVNDTNPTYYYCGAPQHCQKGMFGIINPTANPNGGTSVSGMMQTIGQSNPDIAAYASYARSQTQGNDAAGNWGGNIDMGSMPDWAMPHVMENVIYTRTFLAQNKEVLSEDGTIDLGSANTTPLIIPQDFSAVINNAAATPASASDAAPGSQNTATDAAPSQPQVSNAGTSADSTSGAISLSSSRILVGVAAVVATLFAL